jgi:hypothetical protein
MPTWILSGRPVTWIGDLSYSWYLWHWPAIVLVAALWPNSKLAPVAAFLSLIPAWISYRLVENPIRFRAGFPPRAVVALVFVCLMVPIAASGGLLETRDALAGNASMRAWIASRALHADVRRGCDNPIPLDARTQPDCTWTNPAARGTIVLVGDSNAGQFTEPVVRAAMRAHYDATVATFSSCPFVDLGVAWRDERTCRAFYSETLRALRQMKPTLVIVAARTDKYIENSAVALRTPSGRLTRAPAEKERLWRQGLTSTLTALTSAGIPIIVVHPTPPFPDAPDQCTAIGILTSGCTTTRTRHEVDRRLLRAKRAEYAALATTSRSWALDFEDDLCTPGTCATARSGAVLYRDGDHLSIKGALTLTRRFYRAIRAVTTGESSPAIEGR